MVTRKALEDKMKVEVWCEAGLSTNQSCGVYSFRVTLLDRRLVCLGLVW